jgi:hypothetical protein
MMARSAAQQPSSHLLTGVNGMYGGGSVKQLGRQLPPNLRGRPTGDVNNPKVGSHGKGDESGRQGAKGTSRRRASLNGCRLTNSRSAGSAGVFIRAKVRRAGRSGEQEDRGRVVLHEPVSDSAPAEQTALPAWLDLRRGSRGEP